METSVACFVFDLYCSGFEGLIGRGPAEREARLRASQVNPFIVYMYDTAGAGG